MLYSTFQEGNKLHINECTITTAQAVGDKEAAKHFIQLGRSEISDFNTPGVEITNFSDFNAFATTKK